MKQFFVCILALTTLSTAYAQKKDSTIQKRDSMAVKQPTTKPVTPQKKDWTKIDLSHRANDHFMVQIGYDGWLNKPDTLESAGVWASAAAICFLKTSLLPYPCCPGPMEAAETILRNTN